MDNTIKYIISVATLAVAFASFSACQKYDFDKENQKEDGIVRFSPNVANSGIIVRSQSQISVTEGTLSTENGAFSIPMSCQTIEGIGNFSFDRVATRGSLINEDGPEAINLDDKMTFYVAAWDDVTSENIIPGTAGSYQKVKKVDGQWKTVYTKDGGEVVQDYYWRKGEYKTFYAYTNLPAGSGVASVSNESASSQALTYTVPEAAADQTDILLGFYSGDGTSDDVESSVTGTAVIDFFHPLTAVQFKKGTVSEGATITGVSIVGVYPEGKTSQSSASSTFSWTKLDGSAFSKADETKTVTAALDDHLLLIPQTFAEDSEACIKINMTTSNGDCVLYYPLAGISWQAGYTNIYTIGFTESLNYVEFEDELFKAYCVANFDTDGDGEISTKEAEAVTEMNMDTNGMETLGGLEYFKNLEVLRCDMDCDDVETDEFGINHFYDEAGNEIFGLKTLDVSRNPKLKELDCSFNRLTSIDLRKNTVLESFISESNNFTSFDFSRNTSLTELIFSENHVKSIDLRKNVELTELSIDGTKLDRLDVSKNVNLVELSCMACNLTSLDVSNNTKLESLACEGNKLADLDVTMLTELVQLSCSDNLLTSLNVSKNLSLDELYCDPMPSLAVLYIAQGQTFTVLEVPETTNIQPITE